MDPFGWPVPLISGPDGGDPTGYGAGSHLPPPHHTQLDLHMGQTPHYQYYRKHGADDLMEQPAQNPRLQSNPWGAIQHSFGTDQQWRQNADGSIMEMRKEKSRDAARSRRGKENYEFYELAKMLPLPPAITSQLDKASIIRLTISYLRLREFTKSGDPPWMASQGNTHKSLKGLRGRHPTCSPVELFELHHGFHIVQALDGFTFILAADGRFLYISETVSIYLGLSQVEMAGSSVFEYIHQEDHKELADQLELTLTSSQPSLSTSSMTASSSPSSLASDDGGCTASGGNTLGTMNPDVKTPMTLGPSSTHKGFDRAFCIRMKSTLTKRGCHFKSSGYRVLLVLGHLRPQLTYSQHQSSPKTPPNLMGLVALAIALPSPSMNELKLEPDMFVSKINFDFRLAHCEPKVSDLLHYSPEELLGRSLYSLCHAQDVQLLRKTHTDLLKKGQVMSPYYRILNKTGGYVWVQTCATVICNSKNSDDQNIICVNYVLSAPLDPSIILDHHQLDPALGGVKTDTSSEYTTPHTPDKTASDSPSCVGVGSPGAPSTPGRSGSGGPQRSPLPSHLQDSVLHESHNALHDPHEGHTTLHNTHDLSESLNDPHKDLRSNSHMEQDPHMSSDPHIPHGAPLTPQLTPVSQMGGTMTPLLSNEGDCIKTETGPVLTPLNAQDPLDDHHRNHKLSPLALHGHLHYTSVPTHTQLSPISNNRYSPISNTQLSPSSVYSGMEKIPQQDLEGSVRHLEAAMTRHLPQDGGQGLSGGQGGFSAIQWAGGQENPSAIIRQIYSTKRETVIRTSRDPQDISSSPPCLTAPCSTGSNITNLPPTSTGAMSVNPAYPAYHISPPSSVSPDRLKAMPCDPYQDIYNTPVYTNNPVTPKNPYDGLRWYPA